MKQNIWCKFLNLHKYEIIKEEKKLDRKGNIIGIVIVSRCSHCGKITQYTVYTEEGYRED